MSMKLQSEINSPEVEGNVLNAARLQRIAPARDLSAVFEHGHWWLINRKTGDQWDACDSNLPGGFDFELVTVGDPS